MRWGSGAGGWGSSATLYFRTLAALCGEWIADDRSLFLPRAQTPELERAFAYVLRNLAGAPDLAGAARAAGVSPRTLARRFESEAHLTYRHYLRTARVLRAMELLAAPGGSVTQAAYAVGFESLGAFTRAFTSVAGEAPRAFRKRVLSAISVPKRR